MKIATMFQKSIDRPINGVIKVMQTDDENRKQELEEYVITRELRHHFGAFYDHYEQGIAAPTDKMGVWISGFFGSGKSHFLKILSYLLANDEVAGKRAIEYFADKFDYDPYRYAMMKRISAVPTEVILFNIDAKSPMGKDQDAILRVFTKVFYEHCGYYGDDLKVAAFERFLDSQGKLQAFRDAFEQINGEAWQTAREAFVFWEDDIVAALTQVTSMSEQAARNWFNGEETAEISIDKLAREISAYVDSREPDFHLVFLVDEIGQYIGDNSGLMLNLQTVVEELGAKCQGKVWVIVTSQEDIDSVTHVKGNDFSKIQGRFNTRLSLSSASVDEVIKRRILEKTEEAAALLRLVYQQNASGMRNLFSFSSETKGDLKGYASEEEFVESYPFVPYQFKLLQDVLVQVRKHGSSGKHLSGGERSMLSAFQEAAQKEKDRDETAFVPFYRFYDTVNTFLDSTVRRVIDRADRAAIDGNGLKMQDVDVLKTLFLIRYVEGFPSNIENLSTLMIDSIHADKISMRRALQESLDRLVHENYVSRNGEIYLFLTDEEQDVRRDLRQIAVEDNDIIHLVGQILFADIYPGRKFRYKGRYDFAYDPMVDYAMISQPSGDIRLRAVTVLSETSESDADSRLILQSKVGNEAIVRLSTEYDYYHELEDIIRITKYVKQRNLSQLPESIRKIITGIQAEAKEHEKTAGVMLREAIVKGSYYIAGERTVIRASSAKDALDQAMNRLVENVYSKLNYVGSFAQSDTDIQQILNSPQTQEGMLGVEGSNARALEDMEQFLEVRDSQHMQITAGEMQKRYQAIPYGWREIDIAALLAALIRAQKLQVVSGGAVLPPTDRKIIDCLRKRSEVDKTLLRRRQEPGEELKRKARRLASELFGVMDLKTDADNLCGQIQALLAEARRKNQAVAAQYNQSIIYPGQSVIQKGEEAMDAVLSKRGDQIAFLEAFTRLEDELLDWQEDFREVEFFFKNQAQIFNSAWELCQRVQRESNYFIDEQEALAAAQTMAEILKMPKPYRRIVELPTLSQTVQQAYRRINDVRLERVQETIVQARGDLHTLAGDDPEFRPHISRIDEELDRRARQAAEAANPTQLDAMITQIITYKDTECRRLEGMIAAKQQKDQPRTLRVKTLRRYDLLPQKRLASREEIDAYVEGLRNELISALRDSDVIQLN